jgi:thiol-disulfide isomerase/thioredoxin
MKRLRIVLLLFVAILLLAACSNAVEANDSVPLSAIELADFPTTLGGGFPVAQVPNGTAGSAEVGQPAPNFAFVWADGRAADLTSLRGKSVIINFWATWCGPCRAEMPELVALHRANPDLVVLEVNTQEQLADVHPFAEEFGMTMPIVMDESGAVRSLYGVRSMPTTLFINAEGVIHARWAGILVGDQLSQFVTELHAN